MLLLPISIWIYLRTCFHLNALLDISLHFQIKQSLLYAHYKNLPVLLSKRTKAAHSWQFSRKGMLADIYMNSYVFRLALESRGVLMWMLSSTKKGA